MRVRRTAAIAGVVLGLSLAGPTAWADEAAPSPSECPTAGPVDEGGGEGAGGGVPPEPEPAPSTDPGGEEPAPEPTLVDESPAPETPAEESPTSETPAEEPNPDEPVSSGEPEPGTAPDDGVVCLYSGAGEGAEVYAPNTDAVRDTSRGGQAAPSGAGGGAAQLPRTGAGGIELLTLGLGLVLVGGGAVVAGTRRTA